jgi:hypothetical protein
VTVSIFSCKGTKKRQFKHTHSTDGHRQKCRTKHNPQQAAKNAPTEAQKKKTPTLKLPNMETHSLKK